MNQLRLDVVKTPHFRSLLRPVGVRVVTPYIGSENVFVL